MQLICSMLNGRCLDVSGALLHRRGGGAMLLVAAGGVGGWVACLVVLAWLAGMHLVDYI